MRQPQIQRNRGSTSAPNGASSASALAASTEISWTSSEGFVGITDGDLAGWKIAYPALHLESQIARASEWLLANPTKRKKAIRRFLTNWLSRAQERGGDIAVSSPSATESAFVPQFPGQKPPRA